MAIGTLTSGTASLPRFLIGYRRVSTDRQGQSGLGLEAQTAAIESVAGQCGGKILAWYDEIETGKNSERPELEKAINHAKNAGALLVVAKLDRLARNAKFLLTLADSGVDLYFCDLPQVPAGAAGRFMLTMFAAVAELEAGMISERTKAALAARRARGGKLGSEPGVFGVRDPEAAKRARAKSAAAKSAAAAAAYVDVEGWFRLFASEGLGLQEAADRLNASGKRTRTGSRWTPPLVSRQFKRLGVTDEWRRAKREKRELRDGERMAGGG